jgi:hypothetical protein
MFKDYIFTYEYMASLIFSHSKVIVNKAKKAGDRAVDLAIMQGLENTKEAYQQSYDMSLNISFREFDQYLNVSKQLHERYLLYTSGDKEYFITLRPDDKRVSFDDFQQKVIEYLGRSCFISYDCAFEQKGESDETLGSGFHCHIVAKMKQRSKGEVLRDTLSSFKQVEWIAPNCIQILPTKNGRELVQNYLIDYKSEDGHKEVTRVWDDKWREQHAICMLMKK